MRIGIFVPNINQGGTERVAANLVNGFTSKGFEVILITMGNKEFPFPFDAKLIKLDIEPLSGKLGRFIYRYKKFQHIVQSYDIHLMLSMGEYPNLLCSLLPRHISKVIRITNSLNAIGGAKSMIMKLISKAAIRRCDLVVLPTRDLQDEYRKILRITKKIKVIANPINSEFKNSKKVLEYNTENAYWLHIGQFVEQKNHYGLLSIYKKYLARSTQKRHLVLLGKGELEEKITEQARKFRISKFVQFVGWSDHPIDYLKSAKGFLLPSHWEGFPNVLIEAMTLAVPVIAYDCHTGPRDILQDGRAGLLVPSGDEEQFVRSMLKLESDQNYHSRYRQLAYQRSKDFKVSNIVNEYIKNFQDVTRAKNV